MIVGVNVCLDYARCRTGVVRGCLPRAVEEFYCAEFLQRHTAPVGGRSLRLQDRVRSPHQTDRTAHEVARPYFVPAGADTADENGRDKQQRWAAWSPPLRVPSGTDPQPTPLCLFLNRPFLLQHTRLVEGLTIQSFITQQY